MFFVVKYMPLIFRTGVKSDITKVFSKVSNQQEYAHNSRLFRALNVYVEGCFRVQFFFRHIQ